MMDHVTYDVMDSESDVTQSDRLSQNQEEASVSSEHSHSGSNRSHSGSSTDTNPAECETANGHDTPEPTEQTERHQADDAAQPTTGNVERRSKFKNPLKLLRRLTLKSDRKGKEDGADPKSKPKPSKFDRILMEVKVESLPQVFVAKYLGFKPCHGLWGIKHTRGPVEELIREATAMDPEAGEDLPLVQLRVSLSGLHVREHSANRCTTRPVARELLPIEFISYGVQDVQHTRLFSLILVREMSSKSRKLECHVYVCDSTATCRRLSLSVALAFKEYSSGLDGKPYKFQVELQSDEERKEPRGDESAEGAADFEA